MSNDGDFVTVRPREVRLTHRETAPDERRFTPPSLTTLAAGGGIVALLVVVFLFAPSFAPTPQVESSPPVAAPVVPIPGAPATAPPQEEPEQPPLEKLIADRERARAQDTLSRYVELQITLEEEMNVDAWAKAEYDAIADGAARADELFTQRKYDEAFEGYQAATRGLEQLVATGEAKFQQALLDTESALRAYRIDGAREALAIASSIHPDDGRLEPLRAGLDELPKLIALTRAADEALRDGDEATARAKLREASILDPDSEMIRGKLAELDARIAERNFQETLSAGYAALDAGRFDEARAAFNRALSQRPGDLGAQQGLAQVRQSGTLDRIQQLREGAARFEAEERWSDALKSYSEALKIDGALKFAVDGKARSAERADLDRALADTIVHPERLSSDDVYKKAVALQARAAAVADPGPRLREQITKLTTIVATASEPVSVTLVSDNATQVTMSHVGNLGMFAEKRVSVRPGRYLVIGSRNGCRDVRKQVDVAPDMSPVDIRCEERL